MTTTDVATRPEAGEDHDRMPAVHEAPLPMLSSEASLMMDLRTFEHMQRVCKVYSASDVVPKQFQGNLPNCMIAFELAHRLQVPAFQLMQSMYVVGGKPGLEAKLVIGLVNTRGPFRGPIRYRFDRDDNNEAVACTAYATLKSGEVVETTITWEVVKKEGWADKPGSKWKTMREQMFIYRSAAWLARTYCPEVILGMHMSDELDDVYGDTRYVQNESTPTPPPPGRHKIGSGAKTSSKQSDPVVDAEATASTPVEQDGQTEQTQDQVEPTTTEETPTEEAKPNAGKPEGLEALCIQYSEMHGVSMAEAEKRLVAEAKKKWKKHPTELPPRHLADLKDMVGNGFFAPNS